MRKGIIIAVILAISCLFLWLGRKMDEVKSLEKRAQPTLASEDLRIMSHFLSLLLASGDAQTILRYFPLSPNDPSQTLLLGILQGEEGKIKESSYLLQRAKDLLPSDPLPSLLLLLYSNKIDARSLPLLEEQLQTRLSGWFRYKPLSRAYRLAGKGDLALRQEEELRRATDLMRLKLLLALFFIAFVFLMGLGLLLLYPLLRRHLSPPGEEILSIGWGWSLLLTFAFLLVMSLIQGISALSGIPRSNLPPFLLLGELVGGGVALLLLWWKLSSSRLSLRDIGLRMRNWKLLGWGVGGWLTAFPLVLASALFAYYFIGGSREGYSPAKQQELQFLFLSSPPFYRFLLLLLIVFFAPFFEELFFRGLVYSSLRQELGERLALILSAFLFGAIHMSPFLLLPVTVLGLVLTYLYERTRSLLPSFLTHALWNGGTLLLLSLLFA